MVFGRSLMHRAPEASSVNRLGVPEVGSFRVVRLLKPIPIIDSIRRGVGKNFYEIPNPRL